MIKDHSDSERGTRYRHMGYAFRLAARGLLYASSHILQPLLHQSWSTGWNEKKLNVSTMKNRSEDLSHHQRALLPRSYIWRVCAFRVKDKTVINYLSVGIEKHVKRAVHLGQPARGPRQGAERDQNYKSIGGFQLSLKHIHI